MADFQNILCVRRRKLLKNILFYAQKNEYMHKMHKKMKNKCTIWLKCEHGDWQK